MGCLPGGHTLWVKPCRLSWLLPTTRTLWTRTSPTGWALSSMQYLGHLESLWSKERLSKPRETLSPSLAYPPLLSPIDYPGRNLYLLIAM